MDVWWTSLKMAPPSTPQDQGLWWYCVPVDGSEIRQKPTWDGAKTLWIMGYLPYQLRQDFFHQPYLFLFFMAGQPLVFLNKALINHCFWGGTLGGEGWPAMIFDHQLRILWCYSLEVHGSQGFPILPFGVKFGSTWTSRVLILFSSFLGNQNFQTHRNHGTKGIFTYSFSIKIDHSCG